MPTFIKGLTLCEGFFFEAAKPILDTHFPNLVYTSGLVGYGSDVLGFDDETSTDHMWGPRFYLFLREEDAVLKAQIMDAFSRELPYTYAGYSVNFSVPNPNDKGIRHAEYRTEGPVSPLIFIYTVNEYLDGYLGRHDPEHFTAADWLAFSEHRLLALTSGKLFVDGLQLQRIRDQLHFYPDDVRLYLIASNWSLLAEEQAFVKRCADVGDETGSALVCARIAERLMRLAFLYCGQYAPYSKWFGTAFERLPIDLEIKTCIRRAVTASGIREREDNLVLAQKRMADLHNALGLTEPVDVRIESYFGRNIQVIYADKLAAAVQKKLSGTPLDSVPLIGTLSEVANFTVIFDYPEYQGRIKVLYDIEK